MKNIDVTKPVKTRNGRKARYVTTLSAEQEYPLVFAVTPGDGAEYLLITTLSGKSCRGLAFMQPNDIVPAPVTVEKFLNVYTGKPRYAERGAYDTATNALDRRSPGGSTLRLTYEDDKLVSVDILAD